MPNTTRRRRTTAVSLLLVMATMLAACSDDDDDAASETTAPAEPPAATDEETPSTDAPSEQEFLFGLMGPGVGLLDELVIGQVRGLTLAIEDINAAGGLLGAPVASVRVDEASGATTEDTLDALLAEGSSAVIGPVSSTSATDLRGLAAERGIIACSASATAPIVTEGQEGTAFFRTALRDDYLASFLAERVAGAEAAAAGPLPSIAIVARDDTYGTSFAGGLAAQLAARGVTPTVITYPARRVLFTEEGAEVAATGADLTLLVSLEEGPNLLSAIASADYPVDQVIGLDGMLNPRIAEQTFPSDPAFADGFRVISTTGDRAFMARLSDVPAQQDQVVFGAQAYDCTITLALAMAAADSTDPVAAAERIREVTDGGRACSNYADCLSLLDAGEDIDYEGATGGIAIDEAGDITTARITAATVTDGALEETEAVDVDLESLRQEAVFAAGVFTAQIQQVLRLLGYYDGEITGVFDQATSDAIAALQADLGLEVTGVWDEATDAAVRELGGAAADVLITSTTQLQLALTELGFYDGPIDGVYSAETIEAVRALQRSLGVPETGIIDTPTMIAIYQRGIESGTPTTTTEPPVTAPPSTEAPAPAPTEPPATAPPATQPPATQPPVTEPPVTAPPVTEPPVTEPPVTEPPTTEPPLPPAEDQLFDVLSADPELSILVDVLRALGF
ncbi:MAG TPA: peptidoglycan-binding protein, partial [Ilumatobacteraceae bacterium]